MAIGWDSAYRVERPAITSKTSILSSRSGRNISQYWGAELSCALLEFERGVPIWIGCCFEASPNNFVLCTFALDFFLASRDPLFLRGCSGRRRWNDGEDDPRWMLGVQINGVLRNLRTAVVVERLSRVGVDVEPGKVAA